MTTVKLAPAHRELKALVAQLNKLDPQSVKKLKSPTRPGSKAKDGQAWVSTIEQAVIELETWCESNSPDSPFTIDVPPER